MTQVPLRRVFRVINGGTPTSASENWGDDVVWVTPADLAGSPQYTSSSARSLTELGLKTGSSAVPRDSIVISSRAPVGYVTIAGAEVAFNQGCKALVPIAELEPRFFYYQFLALNGELGARANGTTFVELSAGGLADVPVNVPSLEQQRRIADFLDEQTAVIKELLRQRKTQLDLIQERANLHLADALAARVESWMPLKRFGAVVQVGIVVRPSDWYVPSGGIQTIRGLDVSPGRIDRSALVEISAVGDELNKKSRLRSGDVVVVRTGKAGAAAVVPATLDGANAIDLLIVRPGNRIDSGFLELLINSETTARFVDEFTVGTIQSHFNVGSLREIPFPALNMSDQRQIASAVRNAIDEDASLMCAMERQIVLLTEKRQALITAAVTGQFDVTTTRRVA